jgi:hypothetical protein
MPELVAVVKELETALAKINCRLAQHIADKAHVERLVLVNQSLGDAAFSRWILARDNLNAKKRVLVDDLKRAHEMVDHELAQKIMFEEIAQSFVMTQTPHVPLRCARKGCKQPPFDGKQGSFCSRSCRAGKTPLCLREGCCKPTWNGDRFEFCSITCRDSRGSATSSSEPLPPLPPPPFAPPPLRSARRVHWAEELVEEHEVSRWINEAMQSFREQEMMLQF